jgi:uncharacterized protein YbjQ (UPF0145 family)
MQPNPLDPVASERLYTLASYSSGLPVLAEATYRARWNAMSRMQAEADSLGAASPGF